jgi:hypothetical protein
VACCRWCGIGLGWSGALAGPPRDQLTGDEPMDQDYPAPPPELVQQWRAAASNVPASLSTDPGGRRDYIDFIATKAARWKGPLQ